MFPLDFHTQRYIKLQEVKWERIVGWIPPFDLKCSFFQIGKLSYVDEVNSDRIRMETEGIRWSFVGRTSLFVYPPLKSSKILHMCKKAQQCIHKTISQRK